ncbi:MAG: hypothetical protein WCQ64_15780 [Acidobacteriota bacterium]
MKKWRVVASVMVFLAGAVFLGAQAKPDLSGTWKLVGDQVAPGGGRGGNAKGGSGITTISGGAVNCVKECTIVQNASMLTISHAPNAQGVKIPDIVLNLDGRESAIRQSADSKAEFKATAKWDGNKLVVTRLMEPLLITQTLTLEGRQLKINSSISIDPASAVTLTYERK